MYAALGKKYPALINRKRILLQQDNAKPHTTRQTQEKIKNLEAIKLLLHPTYNPDLAPPNYHLFRFMAHFLRSLGKVENGCRKFFASKNKKWYRSGIWQLANRWIQAIDSNGFYFET